MLPWLMTACIYPCVLGPDFWGLVNREWRMCTKGQMQSPVNIDPSLLLFDPHLHGIHVDNVQVDALLENIGQLPIVTLNNSKLTVNITNGPAAPYRYRLHQIIVHFGKTDGGEKGSEHTIDRVRFPAEIQLLAYNSELYDNFTQALSKPRGLLAIGIIVDIGHTTNPELRRLTVASQSITYKGTKTPLTRFHPAALLPRTAHYVTYDGSLTFPGCHETVVWVIMNNPIYITKDDLAIWNELQKTETKQSEPSYMTPAYRPLKALNGRLIRTNINVSYKQESPATCQSNLYTEMGYRANARPIMNNSIHKRELMEQEVLSWDSLSPV
ncbi:unnamed protein product, partial [Mesorhabditis belari]|uniref:Alpha-carbonic anhydrase domain-containing protein n=1 Tax=Mesorhabditis belari TaxID=2138241 RepID=A0AAF3F4M8_9BILA